MTRRSVEVRIAGKAYRIRSDADEDWLHQVASHVDAAMAQIRDRTATVDSLDVAMLTCLNLAREVLALRQQMESDESVISNAETRARVKVLIELVESTLDAPTDDRDAEFGSDAAEGEADESASAEPGRADLLTLAAGAERADGPTASTGSRNESRGASGAPMRDGEHSPADLAAGHSSIRGGREAG